MSVSPKYDEARITWEGPVPGPLYAPIQTFCMRLQSEELWFVGEKKYYPNGRDYSMLISQFGLSNKYAAGSESILFQKEFNKQETELIKSKLISYFTEASQIKGIVYLSNGTCKELQFSENWIRLSSL
jgi:hypothetical protein